MHSPMSFFLLHGDRKQRGLKMQRERGKGLTWKRGFFALFELLLEKQTRRVVRYNLFSQVGSFPYPGKGTARRR